MVRQDWSAEGTVLWRWVVLARASEQASAGLEMSLLDWVRRGWLDGLKRGVLDWVRRGWLDGLRRSLLAVGVKRRGECFV